MKKIKILKTEEVKPIEISNYLEETFQSFQNREHLHNNQDVPDFCTYIDVRAWDTFINFANHAHRNKGHEACGVIIGQYFKDRFGEFIVGCVFEHGTGNETNAVWCEISFEDNARIANECRKSNMLQLIWIHSHPGYGAFYSGRDNLTLKESYYTKSQIGIVVDNIKNEYKAFKVINGEIQEFKKTYLFKSDAIHQPFSSEKPSTEKLNASQLFQAKIKVAEISEENIKLKDEIFKLKQVVDEVQRNDIELLNEFDKINEVNQTQREKIETLREEYEKANKKIEELSQSDSLRQNQENLQIEDFLEYEKLRKEKEELNSKLKKLQEDYENLAKEISEKQDKFQSSSSDSNEQESLIDTSKKKIKTYLLDYRIWLSILGVVSIISLFVFCTKYLSSDNEPKVIIKTDTVWLKDTTGIYKQTKDSLIIKNDSTQLDGNK